MKYDFSEVQFKVCLPSLEHVITAGYTEDEVAKVTTSWKNPLTEEKHHKVEYFINI